MKKIHFKIIMVCVVVTIFLIRVIPLMNKNVRCDANDRLLQMSFNGIVYLKYIDSAEHSYKTVVIKNFEDSLPIKILLDLDVSDLFNNLNVNDTIYKRASVDSFFIFKNGQKTFFSNVDFGCKR